MTTIIPTIVREAVQKRFDSQQPVLGSALGFLIYSNWPEFSREKMKTEFGSLAPFLKKLDPDIRVVGSQGGDILFQKGGGSLSESQNPERIFWRLFTNPNLSGDLFIREGRLTMSGTQTTPRLSRMTLEDNKKLGSEFVSNYVAQAHQGAFEQSLLKDQDFWPAFQEALNQGEAAEHHRRSWGEFRKDRIQILFQDRCRDVGATDTQLPSLWQDLQFGVATTTHFPASKSSSPRHDLISWIGAVIAEMTDEELQVLSLPAHAARSAYQRIISAPNSNTST